MPESVKVRLLNIAEKTKTPYAEILQYYGIERFLYRFSKSKYSGKFILKGALMFSAWNVAGRRKTLDVDFLGCYGNTIEEITGVVKEICAIKTGDDGIVFYTHTLKAAKIKENDDYSGIRVRFTGFIERTRIPLQVDFGFGDIVYPEPGEIDYPVFLDFPAPKLKGYPPETVIAEKFEAMIKLGALNSRMKDFYDVWLLIRKFDFKPEQLAKALERTFEHRKTGLPEGKKIFAEEIYDQGSGMKKLWRVFLNKNNIKIAPEKLSNVAEVIEEFLAGPIKLIRKRR